MWRDEALLLDIALAAKKAIKYVNSVSREQFFQNDILQDAVARQLEIIGEAAGKISLETKNANPKIPWLEMVGMRNRLIHEYFRIDLEKVWETLLKDIPGLLRLIEPLIPPEK